jgi:hypothetical protein
MDDDNIQVNCEPIQELGTSDAAITDNENTGGDPQQEILASDIVENLPPGGAPQCETACKVTRPDKPTESNTLCSPWEDQNISHICASDDPSPLSRPPPAYRGKTAALVGLTNGAQRPRAGRAPPCGELGTTGTLLRRGRAWPRGGGYHFDPYVGEVRRPARPAVRSSAPARTALSLQYATRARTSATRAATRAHTAQRLPLMGAVHCGTGPQSSAPACSPARSKLEAGPLPGAGMLSPGRPAVAQRPAAHGGDRRRSTSPPPCWGSST